MAFLLKNVWPYNAISQLKWLRHSRYSHLITVMILTCQYGIYYLTWTLAYIMPHNNSSLSEHVRRSYKVKRLESRSYFLHQPNKSRKYKRAFLVYTSKCAIQTRSNSAGGHCWIPFLFAQRDTRDLCRMTWGISTQVLLLKWRWLWQNWFRSRGQPEMSEFWTTRAYWPISESFNFRNETIIVRLNSVE